MLADLVRHHVGPRHTTPRRRTGIAQVGDQRQPLQGLGVRVLRIRRLQRGHKCCYLRRYLCRYLLCYLRGHLLRHAALHTISRSTLGRCLQVLALQVA